MHIYHLNCGTMTFQLGQKPVFLLHCLLMDTGQGLVLVDTGWGTLDYRAPAMGVRVVGFLTGFRKNPAEAAIHQIERLGYQSTDVKHIVMTPESGGFVQAVPTPAEIFIKQPAHSRGVACAEAAGV